MCNAVFIWVDMQITTLTPQNILTKGSQRFSIQLDIVNDQKNL